MRNVARIHQRLINSVCLTLRHRNEISVTLKCNLSLLAPPPSPSLPRVLPLLVRSRLFCSEVYLMWKLFRLKLLWHRV
jgi:hypothetical protein